MAFPVIIDQAGPLPISTTVQWPSSGNVIIALSGSAFAQTPGTMLRVKLYINSTWIGNAQLMANHAGTHLTLPTGFIATHGEFGEFKVTLKPDTGTITDQNDHFQVALLY